MSLALPLDAERVWTFDDLQRLSEDVDWRRCEVVDGVLLVSPSPSRVHERLVVRIGAALLAAVPDGWDVIASTTIDLAPSYRIPDVTVIAERAYDSNSRLTDPADVLLVVEIESPTSLTTDRVTKPAQYAAAGIEHYWRLEVDPLRLVAYRLQSGRYATTGSWDGSEPAVVADPFDVHLDLATLLP